MQLSLAKVGLGDRTRRHVPRVAVESGSGLSAEGVASNAPPDADSSKVPVPPPKLAPLNEKP